MCNVVANDSQLGYHADMTYPISKEDLSVKSEAHSLLWRCELKATKPRLELVESLFKEKKPLSSADIHKKIKGKSDRATTYRTLEQLYKAGGVTKMLDARDGRTLYEIRYGRPHHHHAVCVSCGLIEDVLNCDAKDFDVSACEHLKNFKSIQSHSLEFFGLCGKCDSASAK